MRTSFDFNKFREDPVDGIAWTIVWLSERWWGLLGLPLALVLALVRGLPRRLDRAGAPARARVVRLAGRQALGWAVVDLGLTAGLPLLRLAYPPIRGAFYYLLVGRAGISGLVTAATLAGALLGRDLRPVGRGRLVRLLWALHAAMTLAVFYATYIDGQRLGVTRLVLSFPGRTGGPPLRLRLAQLTDIHMERLTRRDAAVVARLRALQPDLILLTGDYVNIDYYDARAYEDLRRLMQELAVLAPRYGVYACLGNVDPPEIIRTTLLCTGVQLLDDTAVTLTIGDRRIQILGAGSSRGHRWEFDLPRFEAAVAAAEAQGAADFRLLLFHTPDLVPQAAAAGVDLYLCGHTHGGQIRAPLIGALRTGSRFGRRYVMGLNRLPNGGYIYTSRGIGFEGMDLPRLRVLCPPEIPVFDVTIGNEGSGFRVQGSEQPSLVRPDP